MINMFSISSESAPWSHEAGDHGRRRGRSGGDNEGSNPADAQQRTASTRVYRRSKKRSWNQRPQSPGLKWYKQYTPQSVKGGRVLVIDYVRADLSKKGTRKVAAQEINNIQGLQRLYGSQRRDEAALRVFHVQNADWAVKFLLAKFNINARDDLVGSDFGRYVCWDPPRNRKPLMSGKSWPTQHDPWRGISKTAFGLDYLKYYKAGDPAEKGDLSLEDKLMELNHYDHITELPGYAYDVFAQRMSLYTQHKEEIELPSDPDIKNPYIATSYDSRTPEGVNRRWNTPKIEDMDNGNAIIIFENSKSDSIEDTLIPARDKWESRWRRLPFYLAYETHDIRDDDQMSLLCAKTILQDVWKAISENWQEFLNKANRHVEILEAKIYERPADESRADEIWLNSSMWLKCERLAFVHQNLVREVDNSLKDIGDEIAGSESSWLESNASDFEKICNLVQEDLVKPTTNLSDLMYKSVGIRDSRHSLELSYSMWRLSWITFIFLPLTFTVSFFGMNVDTFENDPSIKWFFITAAPLMIGVLVSWFVLKHSLVQTRQTPYSRGIYERFFHDLASDYPLLWSRTNGPQPLASTLLSHLSFFQRLEWRLVRHWNTPERTILSGTAAAGVDEDFDGLDYYSYLKRWLSRRWTAEIASTSGTVVSPEEKKTSDMEDGTTTTTAEEDNAKEDALVQGLSSVNEALHLPVPPGGGQAVGRHRDHEDRLLVPMALNQRVSAVAQTTSSLTEESSPLSMHKRRPSSPASSDGRTSSVGGGSVMVEEREPVWLNEEEDSDGQ